MFCAWKDGEVLGMGVNKRLKEWREFSAGPKCAGCSWFGPAASGGGGLSACKNGAA